MQTLPDGWVRHMDASHRGLIFTNLSIDLFFDLGKRRVHFHCDKRAGQNKNKFLMFYMMYGVLRGLHDEATVSFLPVGHTECLPDCCFGLFKRHFRRS